MTEIERIFRVCISVLISLSYCYFISSRIPKGKYRFFSVLPVLFIFIILPLYLSFLLNRFITFFFITWLGSFKLLLFCFDHGPLSWGPQNSFILFVVVAALPSKIKLNKDSKLSIPTKPRKVPLNLATEVLLLALVVTILHNSSKEGHYTIHPKLVLVLLCCLLYLIINVFVASSSKVVQAIVGVELEPPSNEPYLSSSLQDFWGKRWNLMITNILRHSVFIPVRSAFIGLLGEPKASLVAVFASFVISALMHEILLFYLTFDKPTWEMTLFFLFHAVCVVVEIVVKRKLSEQWQLPPYISGPLTLGFVIITTSWLFMPPLTRAGVDVKAIEEFMLFFEYMKDKVLVVLMYLTA